MEPTRNNHVLRTPRLIIRPLALEDGAFILELLNDPSFLEHVGDRGVRTLAEAESYLLAGPMQDLREHGFALSCVTLADGIPIGICGLLKRQALNDVDVGYALLPGFRGRGYAREAVAAVLADAAARHGFRRVAAVVNAGNLRSRAILRDLGFRSAGTVRLRPDGPELLLQCVTL